MIDSKLDEVTLLVEEQVTTQKKYDINHLIDEKRLLLNRIAEIDALLSRSLAVGIPLDKATLDSIAVVGVIDGQV